MGCARCTVISFSLAARDCSWYAGCDLNHLCDGEPSSRTVVVRDQHTSADDGAARGNMCIQSASIDKAARPVEWPRCPAAPWPPTPSEEGCAAVDPLAPLHPKARRTDPRNECFTALPAAVVVAFSPRCCRCEGADPARRARLPPMRQLDVRRLIARPPRVDALPTVHSPPGDCAGAAGDRVTADAQ